MLADVKIESPGHPKYARVFLNGEDVSGYVSRVQVVLTADGVAEAHLLIPASLELEVQNCRVLGRLLREADEG